MGIEAATVITSTQTMKNIGYILILLVLLISNGCHGVLNLPILGNQYIVTEFQFPTNPRDGERNRAEYARQFGPRGERLIEELGKDTNLHNIIIQKELSD